MSAIFSQLNCDSGAYGLPSIAPSALRDAIHLGVEPISLFDVRRAEAFASQPLLLEGARRLAPWMIPAQLGALRMQQSAQPLSCHLVVMVCVYGHAVSQSACRLALCHGFQAAYLDGGLDAWLQAGFPTNAYEGPY